MKKTLSMLLAGAMLANGAGRLRRQYRYAAARATRRITAAADSNRVPALPSRSAAPRPLTGAAAIYGNAGQERRTSSRRTRSTRRAAIFRSSCTIEDDEHDAEKAVSAYNALKD